MYSYVCNIARPAESSQRERREKNRKRGIELHSTDWWSVHGLGQGRTGNMRPGVVGRATWCTYTADHLHQAKQADGIKANAH